MKRSVVRLIRKAIIVAVALGVASFGFRATAPAIAGPTQKHPFSMSIVSVVPGSPVAGQKMTISYVVKSLAPGTVYAHIAGSVAGGFPQTVGGKPAVDTAYPGNQEIEGTFTMTAGAPGSSLIELTLSHAPCGASAASNPACATTFYATATTMVAVLAPTPATTVRVRIAGTTYADVHSRSKEDTAAPNDGYLYVSHNPDCRAGYFASGNNGNDTFFKKRDLPAGAKLVAVDFTVYGPPTMKSQYYKGGVGGSGSYGVKLEHDSGDALHVHWENACQGPFRDINLDYSISFEVEIPKGTDLGEVATDATLQPRPPTIPDGLAELSGGTNAATVLIPEPVYFKLPKNGDTYFYATYAPAAAGTISAIENDQSYPIILIANDRLGAGCVPAGNVVLAPQQTTTAAQLTALYGAAPLHSPSSFTACSPAAPATRSELEIVLTFQQN